VLLVASVVGLGAAGCGRNGLRSFEVDQPDGGGGIDTRMYDVPPDGRMPRSLVVAPDSASLAIGDQMSFKATLSFNDGSSIDATSTAVWTSSDASIASVSAGRVQALRVGSVAITAATGGLTGVAKVSVRAVLKSVNLTPSVTTIVVGSTATFTAIGTFSDGTTSDVTNMATSWSATPAGLLAFMGNTAVGRSPGSAVVTATFPGGLSASASVRITSAMVTRVSVTPPNINIGVGTTAQFAADATLSDGTHQNVTASATWSSSSPMLAPLVSPGMFRGVGPTRAIITATFSGFAGTATLTVSGAPLLSIDVEPINPLLGVGVSLAFTATGLYADGTRADITSSVVWSTSAPAVVSIDPTGRAMTRAVGTATITASASGVTGSSTVTVTTVSLRSLSVVPAGITMTVGATAFLRAIGTYSDGSTVDLTSSVTWTVQPFGVISVPDPTGVFQALSVGSAGVTATFGNVSGSARVVVSAATITAIVIIPAAVSLPVGTSLGLAATGFFSDGSSRDVTNEVAWSSSNDGLATVSNQMGSAGLVTGVKPGDVTITATENGVSAKASVSVVPATLESIDVQPANATVTVSQTRDYRATGTFSDGTTADLTAQVTWTTGDGNVATIANAAGTPGQLLGRAPGTTSVTATLGAIAGSTTVTVVGRVLSGLTITPPMAATPLGIGVRFTATAMFTDGTQRDVTAESMWASMNPMVASVDANGNVTTVSQGGTAIRATFMNLSAVAMLNVLPPVARSLVVTPLAVTLPTGFTTQLTATATFSDGSTRDVTAQATWSSSNPMVAGVRDMPPGRGQVTTVGSGTATIRADFMGVSATAIVTVP
jgi:hypothetical protein